jgi:predicted ATPase/class 3 adenylate cyclase
VTVRRSSLPAGTVTFLFTDIEGSTRIIERAGAGYPGLLEAHREIIRRAVDEGGGVVFGTEGDAVFAAFDRPSRAIAAAVAAQRGLAEHPWPAGEAIRVRMGLHTGEALLVGDDYVGLEVHRAARIAAAAHGGQVLVSEATIAAAGQAIGDGIAYRDLGLHRLKDLSREERIAQLDIVGLSGDFPPIRTLEVTPNNLPVQLTSFVGREAELAETHVLLDRSRLLTFVGPGGTGKTRLALALAADVAGEYPGGVRWVPLEAITDPTLVPSAIADAFELADVSRPPLERVIAHVADKRILVVIDNVEQVVQAATALAELLRRTTGIKVLATSRIALAISGEQRYTVPPLPMPTPEGEAPLAVIAASPAVQLFVERATAVRPDFRLTSDNASSVSNIVRGLDGLPLAIELAAARIRLLTPTAIESRLMDRLALLASTGRDLSERQRTIRGAIAWSHELLSDADKRLFARFGVFAGGSGVDEVEPVCGPSRDLGQDILDGIGSLADQSLVRSYEDTHGDPRFAMFMTIADYARERLAESGEERPVRERHARTYLALAESVAGALTGPHRREALDRLADDHDNLRAALDTLVELGMAEEAERLIAAIWRFWQFRGHLDEGAGRAARVLAMGDGRDPDGRPRRSRLHALAAAGGIGYWSGHRDTAARAYEEAATLARELGDHAELGEALFNLSFAPRGGDDSTDGLYLAMFADTAWRYLEEALAEFRLADDDLGTAKVLWQQGDVLSYRGDFDRALVVLEEALGLFERLDDHYWAAWTRHLLGLTRLRLEDDERAEPLFAAALRAFDAAGDVSGVSLLLFDFAELAYARGDEDLTLRFAAAALALGQRTGSMLARGELPPDARLRAFQLVRAHLDRREELVASAMSAEEAAALALGASSG